jgi:hypothetical protein
VSGFQEILVIAVIVLAVVFIPRIRSGQRQLQAPPRTAVGLSGKLRLAVAASFVYAALAAAIMQPWQGNPIRYVYIGLGPVALGWLLYWVFKGFRRR